LSIGYTGPGAIMETSSDIKSVLSPEVQDMLEAGVHFGHRKSNRHPKMAPYIFTVKGSVEIIDVTKTQEFLDKACAYLENKAKEGGLILFAGTRPHVKDIVQESAQAVGMPYVKERWFGGTLTNFSVMIKRLENFKELERKAAAGELDKYTKQEQVHFNRQIVKLNSALGGLKTLTRKPDVLVLVSLKHDTIAATEALKMKIPVVAIADTNVDPTSIMFPIPANDDAISSVRYVFAKLIDAIQKGKAAYVAKVVHTDKTSESKS